jgi:hypothetical protein
MYKLASQRFDGGGGNRQLRPVLFSGENAVAGIRAPQVNVNAGAIQYTPFRPPDITGSPLGQTLAGVASVAGTIAEEAFKFQQRQDQVTAQYEALALAEDLRQLYYGDADGNGGFGNTTGRPAAEGYKDFHHMVEAAASARLKALTPQQRAMAMSSFASTRNAYLAKGASHASSQLAAAEADLVDRTFNQAMLDAELALAGGEVPDVASIRRALGGYAGDTDEYDKRRSFVTESLLYRAPPGKASEIASILLTDPSVGDAKVVQDFIKARRSDARAEESAARERANYQRTLQNHAREDAERQSKNYLIKNSYGAIFGADGTEPLQEMITAIEGANEPAKAAELIQESLKDTVSSVLRQEQDPAQRQRYFDSLMSKRGAIPIYAQDEVVEAAQAEMKAWDDRTMQELKDFAAMEDAKREVRRANIDTSLEELSKMALTPGAGFGTTGFDDLATTLHNDPDLSDGQRSVLNRIVSGSKSPFEPQMIREIEQNWTKLVNGELPIDTFATHLSQDNYQKILERLGRDKRSGAGTARSLGYEFVEKMFEDPAKGKSIIGGLYLQEDTDTGMARINAKTAFNEFFESELGTGVGPMNAMNNALTKLMASEAFRRDMPQALDIQRTGATATYQPTFADANIKVVDSFPVGPLAGLQGPGDLVSYVRNIAKRAETEVLDAPPDMLVKRRIVDVYQALEQELAAAETVEQVYAVQRKIRNHAAQEAHVSTLKPFGGADSAETVDNIYDGDTYNGKRSETTNAAEMGTSEGEVHKQQLSRTLSALSGNTGSVYFQSSGAGRFGRNIGQGYVGKEHPASIEVILAEEYGVPLYQPQGATK